MLFHVQSISPAHMPAKRKRSSAVAAAAASADAPVGLSTEEKSKPQKKRKSSAASASGGGGEGDDSDSVAVGSAKSRLSGNRKRRLFDCMTSVLPDIPYDCLSIIASYGTLRPINPPRMYHHPSQPTPSHTHTWNEWNRLSSVFFFAVLCVVCVFLLCCQTLNTVCLVWMKKE